MNIRSCILLFSLAISSITIPSMHKVEPDALDCVSHITGIQKLILEYLYEWQPRETLQCSDRIYSQTYTLDGNYLIVGLDSQQIEIYDAHTRELVKKFDYICKGRGTAVEGLCALPNQKFLASVSTAGALILYNLQNPMNIKAKMVYAKQYEGHAKKMALSPKGEIAMPMYGARCMKIWKLHEDAIGCLGTYKKHHDAPYALAYSPDGNYLATGAYEQVIKISDTKNYHTVAMLDGNKGYVKEILWTAQNRIIALYGPKPDKTEKWVGKGIKIWDVSNIKEPIFIKKLELQHEGNSIVGSCNNQYLIVDQGTEWCKPSNIQIWDTSQEKFLDLPESLTSSSDIAYLTASPDGRYLACASHRDDGRVLVWENPAAALLTAINNKNKK